MFESFCTLCGIESSFNLLKIVSSFCNESRVDYLIPKYLHIGVQSDALCVDCLEQLKIFHEYYEKVHKSQKLISLLITSKLKVANEEDKIFVDNIIEEPKDVIFYQTTQSPVNQSFKEIHGTKDHDSIVNSNMEHKKDTRILRKTVIKSKKTQKFEESIKKNVETRVSFMSREDLRNVNYDADKNIDSKISNFMDLICTICQENFFTFNRLMRHYHNIHQIRGYINCCDLKFYTRIELDDHIDCNHLNSDKLRCYLCHKKLANSRSLKRHMTTIHHWKKEDLFPCDLCSNISFSKRIDLKKHKFEKHNNNNYVCSKCKRTFKSESKLLFHEENIHNRKSAPSLVCDLCGKIFKSRGGFHKHTKEVHEGRVLGRQECDTCGSLVKNLNYHKRMAHPPEGTIIKCKECNKLMKTWFALKSHRANVHNVNRRKFCCNICDKGFKNKRLLLEHDASHTGRPLYTCLYCSTTFKHESNFLKHKKRQHLKEWTEEKQRKYLNLKSK